MPKPGRSTIVSSQPGAFSSPRPFALTTFELHLSFTAAYPCACDPMLASSLILVRINNMADQTRKCQDESVIIHPCLIPSGACRMLTRAVSPTSRTVRPRSC